MLQGYKTYIFGGLALMSVLLRIFELIDAETMTNLLYIFVPAQGMSLRSAITKSEPRG